MTHSLNTFRIAQVIGRFGGGGAQRAALNLALGLQDAGCQSTCIALRFAAAEDAGILNRLEVIELRAEHNALAGPAVLMRLRQAIAQKRFDLVWVHGAGCLVPCALAMAMMRGRPKLWFTWHDSQTVLGQSGMARRAMLWAMKRCERIYGSSSSVVQRLASALEGRRGTLPEVFPNGVPIGPISSSVAHTEPTIIWASRFVPSKDPQILLRAAANLKQEGLAFRIILAGDALPRHRWYYDQTMSLVSKLGLGDRIEILGWVDDLIELYCRSAIGVQTSQTEGLSMTLLEQMMAGLAIVATDVGDTASAIDHRSTGLLIRPQNERELTDALRELIGNPELRQRLADAARRRAVQRFSLEAIARHALARLVLPQPGEPQASLLT